MIVLSILAIQVADAQTKGDSLKKPETLVFATTSKFPKDSMSIHITGKNILIVNEERGTRMNETKIGKEELENELLSIANLAAKSRMPKTSPRWSGFEFGLNMMTDGKGSKTFPENQIYQNDLAKSLYFNLNFLDHKFNIYKNYVGITTGLGFNFNHFAFKDNYVLNNSENKLSSYVDTLRSYSKNKLNVTYLQVPLLLQINTSNSKKKSFAISAGVIGGVRIGSKLKQKYTTDINGVSADGKYKGKNDYALNPVKLDATLRVGYKGFGVFANYSLIPLFDLSKTVAVHPATIGISLSL